MKDCKTCKFSRWAGNGGKCLYPLPIVIPKFDFYLLHGTVWFQGEVIENCPCWAQALICEVCGAPAAVFIQDYKPDHSTPGMVRKIPAGEPHIFCETHKREPLFLLGGLDGNAQRNTDKTPNDAT